MIGKLCAILGGVALTWTCAAFGIVALLGPCRIRTGIHDANHRVRRLEVALNRREDRVSGIGWRLRHL
jgi:hypothetical protein